MDSTMAGFFQKYNGTRARSTNRQSALASVATDFLRSSLEDYRRMSETGTNLVGETLTDRQLTEIRRQIPLMEAELARR